MPYSFTTLVTGVSNIDDVIARVNECGLKYKDDENVMLIFSDVNQRTDNPLTDDIKSLILDKKTLEPITTQFNKIIYNKDAIEYLQTKDWNGATIKECYEGTMILVFYHADKWYVCTRKCIDAKTSFWVKDVSYYDLFVEAIDGKFKFDDLNKEYCYHFILLHHLNKNIVNYQNFDEKYKTVALAMTTKKTTFEKVEYHINDTIKYPKVIQCSSLEETRQKLSQLSRHDTLNQQITTEGFIIEYQEDKQLTILKLQTHLYEYVASLKPNVNNMDAMFLELYQKDKLVDVAPYFTRNSRDVVVRIHNSFRNITSELLPLYHDTRNHKSPELYDLLPTSYKNILYAIHGLYIKKKSTATQVDVVDTVDKIVDKKSITVYDIYACLKQIEPYTLRRVFTDRLQLLENPTFDKYFNKGCFDTMLQGKLMQ